MARQTKQPTAASTIMTAEQVADLAHDMQFASSGDPTKEYLGEVMNEVAHEVDAAQRASTCIRRLKGLRGKSREADRVIDETIARIEGRMEKETRTIVYVGGRAEALLTATYQQAVNQFIAAIGTGADELAAAAWYVQHAEAYQRTGLAYRSFMETFRNRGQSQEEGSV